MKRYIILITALLLTMLSNSWFTASAQTPVHVAKYYGDREAALTFTFDDGLQEHYTEVFPRLKQLGLKASFGIIGSKVGSDWKKIPTMTWEQLREMAADGQEITSHGWQHRALLKLSGESLRYEVQHNDSVIHEHLGFFPRTYFYPGNRKTDEGVAFCSKNRVGTRMFQGSFGSKRDSAWVQCTLVRTLKKGEWTVWMTHGISVGYDAFPDPQLLWNTMEQVAGMQDRLWVATLHDALAYIAERDTVMLDVKQQKDIITVTPKNPLDKQLFFHPLTLVVDGEAIEAKQGKRSLPVTRKGGKSLFDFDPNGGKIQIKMKN
ncbi:MAG: polysaccharide deacetylase family protein [Prevotella sp.]|nr:polysaccharide deacetylase family protein [Prevotella sp.]